MRWFRCLLLVSLSIQNILLFAEADNGGRLPVASDSVQCYQYPTLERDYVLLINSYHIGNPWGAEVQSEVIKTVYGPNNTGIYIEYLDHLDTLSYEEVLVTFEKLFTKYSHKPKAIVILGTLGWELYRRTVPCDWKEIEVVLALVRDSLYDYQAYKVGVPHDQFPSMSLKESCKGFNATIVRSRQTTPETVKLMQRLMPEMKQVAFILDDTFISRSARRYIEGCKETFKELSFIFFDKKYLTTQSMLDSIMRLDKTTGVIFFSWFLRPQDTYYQSDPYILYKYITTLLEVPSFIISDLRYYNGLFAGGCFATAEETGIAIASIVKDVLCRSERDVKQREIDISYNIKPRLDYQMLKQFGLDPNVLSDDPDIIYTNKPLTFWQKNQNELELVFVGILLFTIIYAFYLLGIKKDQVQRKREALLLKETADLHNNMPILYARLKLIYDTKDVINDILIVNRNNAFKTQIEDFGMLKMGESSKLLGNIITTEVEQVLKNVDTKRKIHITEYHQASTGRYYHIHLFPSIHQGELDAFFSDITELVLAQKKISDYKERVMNLYKDLPIAVALFNRELQPIDCNRAFRDMLGLNMDNFKSRESVRKRFPLFSEEETEAIQNGTFVAHEIELDYNLLERIGGTLPYKLTRTVWCVIEPIRLDKQEQIDSYALLLIDHTEINRAIEEIERISRLNSKTLMSILDNMPVGVSIKDADNDFKYVYWNKETERLMQIPVETVIGENDFTIGLENADVCYQEDKMLTSGEINQVHREDNYKNLRLMTRKCMIPGQNDHHWVLVSVWDITERREAEQELIVAKEKAEESNRLKSAFLANMSHEIRTPLNAIVGFSEVLVDADTEEERQMYASHIAMNNDILLQLISDILDLSKIEAETFEFVYKEVDINELLIGLAPQIKLRLDESKVQFRIKQGLQDCIISTEKNRLIQVISNLVNNSIKFTNLGFITLGYELLPDRQWLRFYVSDTGCGIEQSKLNFVFERFVKLNDFVQGTGLGLAICKTIVERLGGQIGVESTVDHGTTFWFTVPYKRSETPNKESVVVTDVYRPIPEFDRKKLILIAEDSKSNYLLFETMLKENYRLLHANDGLEAVRLYQDVNPDIIIMDIKMPKMDGYEATRIIRKENSQIPIIAVTAYAFADDEDRIMSNGFTAYLTKPIKKREFLAIIEKHKK